MTEEIFSEEFLIRINQAAKEIEESYLQNFGIPQNEYVINSQAISERQAAYSTLNPEDERDWACKFSNSFNQRLDNVEKDNKARLLMAIVELCKHPMTPKAKTITPLLGELAGYWRYRIGESRLIYHPNRERKVVEILEFDNRGDSY